MAVLKTLLRGSVLGGLGLVGSLGMLCACGSGEVSQTVFNIESFCTFTPQLAIIVEIDAASDAEIDSVSATLGSDSEQSCYLEHTVDDRNPDDAGAPDGAVYSCLTQGAGTYAVRVTSGKRTWTQNVELFGDKCHVTELQKLSFELD